MLRTRSIMMASLAMLLVLTACTGVPASPSGDANTAAAAIESEAGDDVTTITWLTLSWNGVEDVIAVFEAENPDINVEAEMVPFNTLFEQIQVRLGANSPQPDVLSVDVPLVAGYGLRGWLLPLEDAFTDAERADWLEAALEAGSYEGDLLAAPVSTSTQLLFYNADLFEKAGITPPGEDERWTMQYIAEIAPQLTMDEDGDGVTDVWGFTWEQTNRIYQLQPMPVGLGGQAIGEDGFTVEGVINSQPWIDAFTYYSEMFNTLKAAPPDDTIPASDLFTAGKLAMYIAGPWNINSLIGAEVDFNWGVCGTRILKGAKSLPPPVVGTLGSTKILSIRKPLHASCTGYPPARERRRGGVWEAGTSQPNSLCWPCLVPTKSLPSLPNPFSESPQTRPRLIQCLAPSHPVIWNMSRFCKTPLTTFAMGPTWTKHSIWPSSVFKARWSSTLDSSYYN